MKSSLAISLAFLCASSIAFAQTKHHEWWKDLPLNRPLNSPNAKKLPLISVRGNKFVDPDGKAILFRGLSISDPDKVEHQGHWNKEHFAKVKEMGTMVVRIPVHPVAWRERTPMEYLKLLDQAVEWCTELGMYIMVDWHSIGNLKSGLFQDPMYDTSLQETFSFWRTIAAHYRGNNTVAFYEFFNERLAPQETGSVTPRPITGKSVATVGKASQNTLTPNDLITPWRAPQKDAAGKKSV